MSEFPVIARFDRELHRGVRVATKDGDTMVSGTITERGIAHIFVTYDDGQVIGYCQDNTEHFVVLRSSR